MKVRLHLKCDAPKRARAREREGERENRLSFSGSQTLTSNTYST